MELRVLQYFLAVAREQNISAAAETLHLSQPALSTQLKNLEAELGKQLLIRGTKGSKKIVLTEEGMILRKRAEEILSLVERTENEITCSNETIVGDVYIGSGETDVVRFFAKAANHIQKKYPDIRFHITIGITEHVLDYLDQGLLDFGLVSGPFNSQKYDSIPVPVKDTWGVLMKKDSSLAQKESIRPEDLWDKPLIISHQKGENTYLGGWLKREESKLHIVATYNLVFNASLLVEEGLGYALCYDKLINTQGSNLCFRPFSPKLEVRGYMIWKKYQVFSKAANLFLQNLRSMFSQED